MFCKSQYWKNFKIIVTMEKVIRGKWTKWCAIAVKHTDRKKKINILQPFGRAFEKSSESYWLSCAFGFILYLLTILVLYLSTKHLHWVCFLSLGEMWIIYGRWYYMPRRPSTKLIQILHPIQRQQLCKWNCYVSCSDWYELLWFKIAVFALRTSL